MKNRLFELPPEILSRVYEYEGGEYYKVVMNCLVFPQMIRACWSRWKRLHVAPYETSLRMYKRFVFSGPNTRDDIYQYCVHKERLRLISALHDFLEFRYWNRMMTCPPDMLTTYITVMSLPDLKNLGRFLELDEYGEAEIYWKSCKPFPDRDTLFVKFVDACVFRSYYSKFEDPTNEYDLEEICRRISLYHDCQHEPKVLYRVLHTNKKWNMVVLKHYHTVF